MECNFEPGSIVNGHKVPPKPKYGEDWVLVARNKTYGPCYVPEFNRILQIGDYLWMPREEVPQREDFDIVTAQSANQDHDEKGQE